MIVNQKKYNKKLILYLSYHINIHAYETETQHFRPSIFA